MNYEEILSRYKISTCILSVEKVSGKKYGDIRILAGNKLHCEGVENLRRMPFVPGELYDKYFPKDLNFEDYCYRCAVLGQPLHTNIEFYAWGVWLNMFMMPIESDDENTDCCIYSYEVTPYANEDALAGLPAKISSDVLKTCIKLRGADDFESAIRDVIKDIRKICGASRCCILLTDFAEKQCKVLCEDIDSSCDVVPISDIVDDTFFPIADSWYTILAGSTCLILKNEEEMEVLKNRNYEFYDKLCQRNVKSVVMFPLRYSGNTIGFMWAVDFDVNDTVRIKETLELTTLILASEISNYQLLKQLKLLSIVDKLTGIKNRNMMNNRIDRLVSGEEKFNAPYAVIFADLNGLKVVNAEDGHLAGDDMLKKAAEILQKVFSDSEIYRAGGDEFMIIAPNITKEELDKRMLRLRRYSQESGNVCFAVGTCYSDKDCDIRETMRIADRRMYADKNTYYTTQQDVRHESKHENTD